MRKVVDNILNNDQIKQLISFAQNNLTDDVTNHAGHVVPRRYTNEQWKYVFTRYDQNEFIDIAESINTAFQTLILLVYELCIILKVQVWAFIQIVRTKGKDCLIMV